MRCTPSFRAAMLVLLLPAGGFAQDPAAQRARGDLESKSIQGAADEGLRYRAYIAKSATRERPHRLAIWLHPSGGSMNDAAARLAPILAEANLALVVFTDKNFAGWSDADGKKVLKTIDHLGRLEGLSSERPLLIGYSAGGQLALLLWKAEPARWGGLALDAAYPVVFDPKTKAPGLANLPDDADAIKKTPLFVLVGDRDGGARLWQQAEKVYRDAGVPLTVEYVPNRGHTWLFGKAQTERFGAWLSALAAGKSPSETVGKLGPPLTVALGVSLDGTRISGVQPQSAADKAGLKVGDILTTAGGRAIQTQADLVEVLRAKAPGDTLELRVRRDGETVAATATLLGRER